MHLRLVDAFLTDEEENYPKKQKSTDFWDSLMYEG